MLVLDDRELVDREPVVARRFAEVKHANLRAANPAVRVDVLHRHAGDEHPMEVAIPGLQRRPGRACQPAQGVFDRVVGNIGIEPGERGEQAVDQDHHAVVVPLGGWRVWCDVRTMEDGPTERFQPIQGDGFDGRFRDAGWWHVSLQASRESCPSSRMTPSTCGFSNLHRWPARSRSPASTTSARSL